MRALGESVTQLPWLSASAASLVTLARSPAAVAWQQIRSDPGAVLLVLSQAHDDLPPSFPKLLSSPSILEEALHRLEHPQVGFADWGRHDLQPIYQASLTFAKGSARLAETSGRCDVDAAWVAGLLAPLGWLAASAVVREPASTTLDDAASISRRLCRRWHLPRWLSAIVGCLDLPPEAAHELGADPDLFRIVQLAVLLGQQHPLAVKLPVSGSVADHAGVLGLNSETLAALDAEIAGWLGEDLGGTVWQAPASQELLRDLLELAIAQRRQVDITVVEALEADTDRLHHALQTQRQTEDGRLRNQKLNALAEFAAGAGHEINNPLAVISGQAQYLLAQESEPARQRSLQKIIGQTQRIHQIITELMQFARPSRPQPQGLDVADLVRDVATSLNDFATQRQVQLVCPPAECPCKVEADSRQARTALTAVLRNAIEAAPADGWAGIRIDAGAGDRVDFVIEDNGPGPASVQREHLFDPFYSGRQAGRGKGLGLAIAWQLARINQGELRFEMTARPTRFVLTLPKHSEPIATNGANHVSEPAPPTSTVTPPPPASEEVSDTNGQLPTSFIAP